MIEIDYIGGLHGHFLSYSINALDINSGIRNINPLTEFGTSHNFFEKSLATENHYTHHKIPFKGKKIISINADDDDCLLVNLLCYGRSGDYKFDLKNFQINFYDQLKNTPFNQTIIHLNESYGIDVTKTNSISRSILREYYKFNFSDYKKNNIIMEIRKQRYQIPVLEINFKQLYEFNSYIKTLNQIIEYFNLEYDTIDIDWYKIFWEKFINKIEAIQCNIEAHKILNAIQQKNTMPIDFNLFQESWLNARLEILYNKEMPFTQEQYFSNTKEINEYLGR